jgi:SNF2 family DNA or RNA helicase
MEMGTGKSRTAIEIVKRREGKIRNVLWFCPVALKQTVRYEILKHTDCTDDDIHVFGDKTNERTVADCFWYIVGIESMGSSTRIVLTANKLITEHSMVIVDESSYIKGHTAIRTERITKFAERAQYRLILTGTPISQGVVDLYAQMRFLSPKILGYNSFYSFAANHLEYSDKYPGMIVRSHNIGYIAAKIQPYVYQVKKEDCLDLPDKLYSARYLRLTDEQRIYYEEAKEEILSQIEEDEIDSIAIFRVFTALQQITCGFWNRYVKGSPVEHIEIEQNRTDTLLNAITSIPENEKIIIWAKYQHDIHKIDALLKEQFGVDSVALFYGQLNEKQRSEQVERFRNGSRFFLSTQSCGGHGLTLNEAHYVIFYNNAFKYSERLQAEDRCHRIGQEHKVVYIDIQCSGTIDDRIANALESKGNAVERFKMEVDKIKDSKGKKAFLKDLIKKL